MCISGETGNAASCAETSCRPADGEAEEEIFPQIPFAYKRHLALRILAFLSLCAVVVSFTVRTMVPTRVNWPMLVAFGLTSLWLCIIVALRKRHNVPKTILWQAVMVSALSLLWDWLTGWKNWSLDYLIPIVFVASAALLYLTAKIKNWGPGLYHLCGAGQHAGYAAHRVHPARLGGHPLSLHPVRRRERPSAVRRADLPVGFGQAGAEQKNASVKTAFRIGSGLS
jgi:hypothetical protein